jgi:hypothetical protein
MGKINILNKPDDEKGQCCKFSFKEQKKAVSEETAFNNLLKYKSNLC